MLKAKLVVVGGDAKAAEISLSLPTVIGRGRDANLTLPHPLVSRQHCELFEKEGMLHVRDLKSLNGTYVGSQRIEASSILSPDQLLTIGNVTFRAIYSAVDASVAEPSANVSNVIEFDKVATSADSDSQVFDDRQDSLHSRPTVPGNRTADVQTPPAAAELDLLKTTSAEDLASHFSESSDVLDEFSQDESHPTPEHSIVAAMHDAGVAADPQDNASLAELRSQLPDATPQEADIVDGLIVDPSQTPAAKADFSSIELPEKTSEKIEADESALGSFIRKLPR